MADCKIEDYALLEKLVVAFLEQAAVAVRNELLASFPSASEPERDKSLERILWAFASKLDEGSLGALDDGRPVRSCLGIVAVGSASAFEVPFIEHEAVLTASRISLHEYVHEAIARSKHSEEKGVGRSEV